jgi:hypothetical protein
MIEEVNMRRKRGPVEKLKVEYFLKSVTTIEDKPKPKGYLAWICAGLLILGLLTACAYVFFA